jgi:hypothetical protein
VAIVLAPLKLIFRFRKRENRGEGEEGRRGERRRGRSIGPHGHTGDVCWGSQRLTNINFFCKIKNKKNGYTTKRTNSNEDSH